jgi:uncharacterized protein YbgA (DUF1722 family)/uncharacterized protein YbbK (DUF523 family)
VSDQILDGKLRLGVSGCLLGEEVRYNGGHKHMPFLTTVLSNYVEWVSVCPEVEVGMGIPRETIRLVGDVDAPRLIAPKSGEDHTEAMQRWAEGRLDELEKLDLHGYVLKKDSPSCGLFRVRVFNPKNNMPSRDGRGMFAQALTDRMPLLPVEEEGRLNDLPLRENFMNRVFFYYRWQQMLDENPTPGGLVKFHSGIKMSLLAHSPRHYREMGQLVANAGSMPWDEITKQYGEQMMDGLKVMSTPGKHVNVLMHLMGFVKNVLTDVDKEELLGLFESYRQRLVPLVVPITLLKHHLNRNKMPDWVHEQAYLNPYPMELMLRNHV